MDEGRAKVKTMLDRNSLTQVWLINRLSERGVRTEKTEFSSVLRGTRKGFKAERIVAVSLEILEHYEKQMETGA